MTYCPACMGDMEADAMGLPLQAAHKKHDDDALAVRMLLDVADALGNVGNDAPAGDIREAVMRLGWPTCGCRPTTAGCNVIPGGGASHSYGHGRPQTDQVSS